MLYLANVETPDNSPAGIDLPRPDYWAALNQDEPDKAEFGSELVERLREYYTTLQETGLIALWRRIHAAFYGLSPNGGGHESSTILEFGDDGEKLAARSNQLRSLVRYIHTSTTTDRPAVQPKASNTTSQAKAQIPTAKRILDHYHVRRHFEKTLRSVALRALLYAKGYLWQSWDPTAGLPGPDGKPKGDLIYRAMSPLDMACDLDLDQIEQDWYMARRMRSRYDLAAIFAPENSGDPEIENLHERIIGINRDPLEGKLGARTNMGLTRHWMERSDLIYEYHFMHRPTPALPKGRYTIMIGEGLVLFDGPLPYEDLPVSVMLPEEFLEAGAIGYASAWDLLGLQQAYDSILSTCLTNFDAFGHNDMLIPDGIDLSVEEVRDGLNAIRYPPGEMNKPSMLEKFSLKDEVFKLREWLKGDLELASGVNATVRGEPQATAKSGSALALLEAQTIHFQSGMVASYTFLIEDASTKTLKILRKYADQPILAAVAGSNDPDGLKEFVGDDVNQISHVECEQVNPLTNTLAGKVNAADSLMERGLIKSAAEYFEVRETGRLESATDPFRKEALHAERVKEILLTGPPTVPATRPDSNGNPAMTVQGCPVLWTDDPTLHLRAAKEVLDTDQGRSDPKIAGAAIAYALEVLTVWRTAPPDGLQLLGYPLPPPAPGAAMDQTDQSPGAGKTPGNTGQPGPAQVPPNGQGAQAGQEAPPAGGHMPSLPKPASKPNMPTGGQDKGGQGPPPKQGE